MLIYVSMIIICILVTKMATFKYKQGRLVNILLILLSIIVPSLVAGLRYNNGADYKLYMLMFKNWAEGKSFFSVKSIEVGFVTFVKATQVLSKEYWFTYTAIALVIDALFICGCWKMSTNVLLSVLLFFGTGTYFDSFNGLRQYMAAAIVFFALYYLLNKDFKKYLLLIIIATFFHNTAIIMAGAYFLRFLKFDIKKAIIVIGAVLVGRNSIYKVVTIALQYTRYSYFLNSIEYKAQTSQSAILLSVVVTIIAFLIALLHKEEIDEGTNTLLNLQIVVICSSFITITVPLAYRLLYYTMPIEIILIPDLITYVKKYSYRLGVTIFLIVFYCVITVYGMYFKGWYTAIPYHFYFNYLR